MTQSNPPQYPNNPEGPGNSGGAGGGGRSPINLSGMSAPPLPPAGFGPDYYGPGPLRPPRRRGRILLIFFIIVCLLLAGSIIVNLLLTGALVAVTTTTNTAVSETTYAEGDTSGAERIVILPITGVINDAQVHFVHEALAALKTDAPGAIVLRVDSPGGGAAASDRIWHELSAFKTANPKVKLVASYGTVAASGGYYVSCLSDFIIAEPGTITGSIGVIFDTFSVEDLLKKIGVDPTVLTATKSDRKDVANNPFRKWGEQDTAAVQPFLDSFYDLFAQRIFDGRSKVIASLTTGDIRDAAHGQACTADEAKRLKLIDEIGYLDDAITKAKNMAGITKTTKVTRLELRHGLSEILGLSQQGAAHPQAIDGETIRRCLDELSTPRLEYRWQAH